MTRARDVQRAGSLNTLIPVWGFVDGSIFVTKRGGVGVAFRLGGADAEGMDDADRRLATHRVEAALRLIGPTDRLYHYLCKRGTGHGATVTGYLVVLCAGWARSAARGWGSGSTLRILASDLARGIADVSQLAAGVAAQLADLDPVRLDRDAVFQFLRGVINPDARRVALTRATHLDYALADDVVEEYRGRLVVGDQAVKVLTMKEAPGATFPGMLDDLYAVPGQWTLCLEWARIPVERQRRDLRLRQVHFFHQQVPTLAQGGPVFTEAGAAAMGQQLGEASRATQVDRHVFGECSLTLVTYGADAETSAARAAVAMAAHDGVFVAESYNVLHAWAAVLPGNDHVNFRRLAVLETHAADLALVAAVERGRDVDDAGRPPLAVWATQQGTGYRYHLHVRDVGHTVVLGVTGSGKTHLVNDLVERAQQYRPRTVVFDLGQGFRAFGARGGWLAFGPETGMAINPFALPQTAANVDFLHRFCKVLIEGADGFRMTEAQDRALFAAITHLYALDLPVRRLSALMGFMPREVAARLETWTEGGRFGRVFDHGSDELAFARIQVCEFGALREYPELLEPLLFYVLHRVTAGLSPETLTICVVDEAWRFIQHPALRSYIEMALKTWRKANGAMILVTQAIEDFRDHDLVRTVVDSCQTALLLANPAVDRETYRTVFHLNDVELDRLMDVRARGQVLLKRQGQGGKVFDVGPGVRAEGQEVGVCVGSS